MKLDETSINGLKYYDFGSSIVMIERDTAEKYFKDNIEFKNYLNENHALYTNEYKSLVFYWKDFYRFLVRMNVITEDDAFEALL